MNWKANQFNRNFILAVSEALTIRYFLEQCLYLSINLFKEKLAFTQDLLKSDLLVLFS